MPSKKGDKGRKKHRIERPCPNLNIDNGEGYYAKIEKKMGGNRVLVELHTGEKHEAIIKGRDRNKKFMNVGEYVLLNDGFEIEAVIRATHPKASEATRYLKKISNGGIIFKDYSDDENESDEELEDIEEFEIKKTIMGSTDKTKKILQRKELNKQRDQARKTEKSFTNVDVLEAETYKINLNKKNKPSNSDSVGDIDIDTI